MHLMQMSKESWLEDSICKTARQEADTRICPFGGESVGKAILHRSSEQNESLRGRTLRCWTRAAVDRQLPPHARVQHQEASRDVSWRHEWMFVFLGCCFSGVFVLVTQAPTFLEVGAALLAWLKMMKDFIVLSFGAELGPPRVFIMDNALSHKRRRRCRCTRPRCTSQVGRRSSQDTQYDTSHNKHPCRLISTHGTRGHERGQAGDVRRPRPRGLGLLYALRRFPRGCCVIARIALRCGLPPMAALLSTSQRTPLNCEEHRRANTRTPSCPSTRTSPPTFHFLDECTRFRPLRE